MAEFGVGGNRDRNVRDGETYPSKRAPT